ncbi:SAF domain-containing protein [Cucurbitaria berberidis CBS 394.84]|uniref:SAF domain-containing protein n=1 Tax=Cucurbitaria berberidis CBS 394.84 TaxID=1168544 RepID=A0A9P4GNG0_9PLEO|nr:SAF domain-containing protein [Cucurbitaria berberidis CBS 394.84]KAF1849693.1 SAF domain-containing protein [Cucurbitaria berberidis CBS 394.84]
MTSLCTKLAALEEAGKPIQVGIIGAGKFGSMYRTKGVRFKRLAAIADLAPERALNALRKTGFPREKYNVTASMSLEEGLKQGRTVITTDSAAMIATPGIDVILEATGKPAAGVKHALLCCEHKKHIVMINVEADVLAGPLLTRRAKDADIIYSMAYGDQPALIAELVDWARTAGFDVVCAGKGTKHLPQYHYSTPDTLASGDFNPQMFNSFLHGTKSALEMAAVANGCDLSPLSDGLAFPPCGTHDLPEVLKPASDGGQLHKKGTVEVVSCVEKDGRWVHNDLRWGVYVIIEAPGEYQKECFKQYGLKTDSTGKYAAQYKPYHLIGLELGISVASIMVRGEPTGQTKTWRGDVVATAKRDLKTGETLDGVGGFMVYGKLMTAKDSLLIEGLPIGLAHGIVLKHDLKKDQCLSWADVRYSETNQVVAFRKEMEAFNRKEFHSAQ